MESIEGLAGCRLLSVLELEGTEVPETFYASLSSLPSLDTLMLRRMRLHPRSVGDIWRLSLSLLGMMDGTHIDRRNMMPLVLNKTIRCLQLQRTDVDDACVAALLETLPALRSVYLDGTQVTDAIGPSLLRVPNLETIVAKRTRVTEALIESLLPHPCIGRIELLETAVTAEQAMRMRRRFPRHVSIMGGTGDEMMMRLLGLSDEAEEPDETSPP